METRKVEYYGATRSFSQIGSAVNSLIAAALVFYTGDFRIVFIAALVPYCLNLINLWRYPDEIDITREPQSSFSLSDLFSPFKNLNNIKLYLNFTSFDAAFKVAKEYLQPILLSLAVSLPLLNHITEEERKVSITIGISYFIIYLLTSLSSKNAYKFVNKVVSLPKAVNLSGVLG